jgi:hypothetical protein
MVCTMTGLPLVGVGCGALRARSGANQGDGDNANEYKDYEGAYDKRVIH